jgi:hypothetical protein
MMLAFRAACLVLWTTLLAGAADANTRDYLLENRGWNGLSELGAMARRLGLRLEDPMHLDWQQLSFGDTLLVIYPRSDLPIAQLLAFVEAGGQLVVADDFGTADRLLNQLGILRQPERQLRAQSYFRNNPHLPIAFPQGIDQPLIRGVQQVVANHASYFRSRLLGQLTFSPEQHLAVTGSFGKGSVVAISDPSILINGMLAFAGNRRFASNLLEVVAHRLASTRGTRGRIFLLAQDFQLKGRLDLQAGPAKGPLGEEFNRFIGLVNDYALTQAGMLAAAFVLGTLGVASLLLFLPAVRRDLDGHWLGGLEAERKWLGGQPSRRGTRRLLLPSARERRDPLGLRHNVVGAIVLRDEIEEVLGERLRLKAPVATIDAQWLADRVTSVAGAKAGRTCTVLLHLLRQLPSSGSSAALVSASLSSPDLEPNARDLGRLSDRDLAQLYELGQALLSALGTPSLPVIEATQG